MLTNKILFLILPLLFTKVCDCRKYHNYTLYRGMPVNARHMEFFRNLSDYFEVNFWRPPTTLNRPVEFVMPPEEQKQFLAEAESLGVYLTTIIPDLQRAFDKQTVKTYIRRNMESFDWKNYYRLRDIYSWLKDVRKIFPSEMNVFSIGKTYENRDVMAVKIVLKGSKRRSKVIVEGGVHAREWIAPAFVTYMILEILHAQFSKNQLLKEIALTYEWYFVPVLNPDGYEYSHLEDRLWRKNRKNSFGVDINRNFGVAFGSVGVSFDRNSDIYCGREAFSEAESQAMAALVRANSNNLEYYIAFHAYGQYMIIPYAHSTKHTENYDDVKRMGLEAAKNISRRYSTRYTVGTAYDTVAYKTSGVSGCWVKRTYKVPYVVTFELRDSGQNGFALPPNQILPTCMETMDGVLSLLKPRTRKFAKLKQEEPVEVDGQKNVILDTVVLVFNVLLFIIVRFD